MCVCVCRTPLMLAVIGGHVDAVSLLLEREASVDLADHQGLTALHLGVSFLILSNVFKCKMYKDFFLNALFLSLSALVWTGRMCSILVGARGIRAAGGLQGSDSHPPGCGEGSRVLVEWIAQYCVFWTPDTSITRQPGIHTLTLGLLLWLVPLWVSIMSLKRCIYLSINWM